MKKVFTSVLILFLLVSVSFSQNRAPQPVEFSKISDSLYQILGGRGANGGAYIGDNGVVVIDSKMDKESVDQVVEGIKKLTDKPIKYLINTHSDGDHIAGNRYFPKDVTIIAHENCKDDFFRPGGDGAESEWKKPELAPFVPSITFNEKMNIRLGSKIAQLWYFGIGHTTGDIVVYFPQEKTAFLGDQIFVGRPQLIHSHKEGNSFDHVKTLTKMLETLDAEKFCSGHSEMMDRPAVANHIQQVKQLQEKVRALIEQGKSVEEIKKEFPENHARLIETICNEVKEQSL